MILIKDNLTFSDFTVVVFYSNRNYFIGYCFDEKLFTLQNKNSVTKFSSKTIVLILSLHTWMFVVKLFNNSNLKSFKNFFKSKKFKIDCSWEELKLTTQFFVYTFKLIKIK